MATSYFSDRSSIAPTDFAVCNSFEEEHGIISVAVENCQLCGCSRRPFYCANCVKAGDFCHSNDTYQVDSSFLPNKTSNKENVARDWNPQIQHSKPLNRYRDKLLRLQSFRKEKSKLLKQFEDVVARRTALQEKKLEANLSRQRIDMLNKAVEQASEKHHTEKVEWKSTQMRNESTVINIQRMTDKKKRIKEYLERLRLSIDHKQGELAICEDQLCQIRQQHVQQLVQHIFPISQVQPRSDSDSTSQSYVSELAEARHTAYIKGRWVYTDNGSEHKYRIVQPTLPGNGDYSSYLNWLLDKASSSGPDPLTGDDHPAFTIGAALTYTTQLVALMAHFLDVSLPERMCYSNFCRNNMSERKFNRLVYKLNHNVLYLCFSQRVDPELLHPTHTIHNILTLLKTQGLGRCRPFAIDAEMIQSLEVKRDITASSTNQQDDSDPSDTDTFPLSDELDGPADIEWERVPMSIPEADMSGHRSGVSTYYPGSTMATGTGRSTLADTQTTSTVMGGLMTSAAASVTSLWRAATWKS